MTATEKGESIARCLDHPEVDLWQLREYAISRGGFLNGTIRKRAWAKLVGLDCTSLSTKSDHSIESQCHELSMNVDSERQEEISMIDRDLGRSVSMRHLYLLDTHDNGDDYSTHVDDESKSPQEKAVERHKTNLSYILKSITSPACENNLNRLHYYQGYHDVASLFLLNLENPVLVTKILNKVSKSHFRDAMHSDFSRISSILEVILLPLIHTIDPEIHECIVDSEIGPFVVLPWIISWFSHDIHDANLSSRIFDFLLASHQLMPLYLSIAIIVHSQNRGHILNTDEDPASIYVAISGLLSKLTLRNSEDVTITTIRDRTVEADDIDIQDLIDDAIKLMETYPPSTLLSLSKRYYHKMNLDQPDLNLLESMEMLKKAPNWSIVSSLPSDSVLRQRRRRKRDGKKPKSNKNQKKILTKIKKLDSTKTSELRKARIACGITPLKNVNTNSDAKKSKIASSLIASMKRPKSTMIDAYQLFSTYLTLGKRKKIVQ